MTTVKKATHRSDVKSKFAKHRIPEQNLQLINGSASSHGGSRYIRDVVIDFCTRLERTKRSDLDRAYELFESIRRKEKTAARLKKKAAQDMKREEELQEKEARRTAKSKSDHINYLFRKQKKDNTRKELEERETNKAILENWKDYPVD